MSGDISFNGKVFTGRTLRYDIYNDEVLIWLNSSTIIILNKEMEKCKCTDVIIIGPQICIKDYSDRFCLIRFIVLTGSKKGRRY